MQKDYLKLHIAILLAGLTGIFGKLIVLDEYLLVTWRLLFASVIMIAFAAITKQLKVVPKKYVLRYFIAGSLLALHWVGFYGSIIKSNISIGVICFSLCGFFSAILEPLILKKKFSFKELCLGVLVVVGLMFIFTLETRYRLGIIYGIISAFLVSAFTILNKKWSTPDINSSTVISYELPMGFLTLLILLPFYLWLVPTEKLIPNDLDIINLIILSSICTIIPQIFTIEALKKISAFTVNLSFNLEPIYSIIIAFIFFGEAKELDYGFYIGVSIIVSSVIIQSLSGRKKKIDAS